MNRILSILILAAAAVACAPTSAKRQSPLRTFSSEETSVQELKADINSKVDILFVIDNSTSMADEQKNLVKNLGSFVDAISHNTTLDFHIGVTTVFDTVRFGKPGRKITPNGYLWPLKDPSGQTDLSKLPPFVTRDTPNLEDVLKATMSIGVMGPNEGPAFEESFSPVLAAVTDPQALKFNQGFYRPDAYLLTVFLSDANDASPELTASELHDRLVALKKDDRSKILAYAANWSPECGVANQDPDHQAPEAFKEFVNLAGGRQFSLCDPNFGSQVAQIGIETAAKVVGRRVIALKADPDFNSIVVKYGSQTVPYDHDKGWSFDPKHNSIILSNDLAVESENGAGLTIKFVPANLANIQNGGTKILGQQK